MPENTDVVAADVKTATDDVTPETVTTQGVTTPPGDTGIQKRIDGLTAEKGRLAKQLEAERQKVTDLVEKHKTDDEKRIDEMVTAKVDAEYGGKLQRLERLEKELTAKRDKIMESVPDKHRAMVDEMAPVETQIAQAEGVLRLLNMEQKLDPIHGSTNPPDVAGVQTYTWNDWQAWQELAYNNVEEFRKRQPEMELAYREGRVIKPAQTGTSDQKLDALNAKIADLERQVAGKQLRPI